MRGEVTGEWRKLHSEELHICTRPQISLISLGRSSQGEWGGRGMWHAWERTENCTIFFVRKPEDVIMGLECILGRLDQRMLSRFSWLRIGASVGLLGIR
jgi:hypothetical protein